MRPDHNVPPGGGGSDREQHRHREQNQERAYDPAVFSSREQLQQALLHFIQAVYDEEEQCPGHVSIGLSGGSMPKLLAPVFAKLRFNPCRLKLFLVDERVVEHDHPDSNYGQWLEVLPEALRPLLAVPELVPAMFRSDIGKSVGWDVARTALEYEMLLKTSIGPEVHGRMPRFDLVLLGMGPDGHTASIFPGSKLYRYRDMHLDSMSWFTGVEDSPKPPPQRITMTLPAINTAHRVAFICTGEDKAGVIKSVLDRDMQYPSAAINPASGKLQFFLDAAAAAKL